jgi:L-threonylcarbamoyladenylate synthase
VNTEKPQGVPILDATDPEARQRAAAALEQGLVVAVPTDTVYGIAARIDRPEGIARLFALKGRRREVAIAVLVVDEGQAAAMGLVSPAARRLAAAFWPGPLTIVVERPPTGAGGAGEPAAADIGGDGLTIGIRVPDHPALLALLCKTGPLATTSANRSGLPTPADVEGVAALFGAGAALYLDGGPSADGAASTVVRDDGGALTVLREGPIGAEELRVAALGLGAGGS